MEETSKILKVICTKCGWIGTEDEQIQIPSNFLEDLGVDGLVDACPNCDNDEFYHDET